MVDGQVECSFYVDGKMYRVTGQSVLEVRKKEVGIRQRLCDEAEYQAQMVDWTLDELYEHYYKSRVGNRADNTLRLQAHEYHHLSETVVAGRKLGEYRVTRINYWTVEAVRNSLNDGRETAKSINHIIRYLSSLLNYAMKLGIIASNPARNFEPVHANFNDENAKKHRALSLKERQSFFRAANEYHAYWENLFRMAVLTGMRLGELGALCWGDVDEEGVLHVRRTLTVNLQGTPCVGKTTKTPDSQRDIPINREIAEVLKEQRERSERIDKKKDEDSSDLVFPSRRGTCLRNDSVNTALRLVCSHAGIEPFSFHAFRATFATCCVQQGMKPETLQKILGHASIVTTMDTYYHEDREKMKQAMNQVHIEC